LTTDIRTSLQDLSADALLELGGLKTRCDVPFKCTEHDNNVPCEICLLEDRAGSVCGSCGQILSTPPVPGERVCASVEQFNSSGQIAFEEDALVALAERDRRKKRKKNESTSTDADKTLPAGEVPAHIDTESARPYTSDVTESIDRKSWDNFKRKHLGNYYVPRRPRPPVTKEVSEHTDVSGDAHDMTPAPAEYRHLEPHTKPVTPAEEPRRRRVQKKTAEVPFPIYEAPATPRPVNRRDANNDLISKISIGASLIATIIGAYVMFYSPWIQGGDRSSWYAFAFGGLTLVTWLVSVCSLFGREPAHGTMPWWSPAVWAFFAAPWPAAAAYLLGKTYAPGQSLAAGAFYFMVGLIAAAFLAYQVVSCGTRLTMDTPWPSPLDDENDTPDDWLWAKILATVVLNVQLWNYGTAMWENKNPAPVAVAEIPARLDTLVRSVNTPLQPARLRNGPEKDRITQALKDIQSSKQPPAGDTIKAGKLQKEALALTAKGEWEKAYPLLKLAHETSPASDGIGILLGLTESLTGRESDARKHLTEALTINPRNSAGWRILGSLEIRDGKGSEASIARASEYYLTSWWFAPDRKRLLQLLESEAATSAAMKEAVQRVQKKIRA